jgi:uncharacterized BrkB/YihY/UPF0761 family membrane protein
MSSYYRRMLIAGLVAGTIDLGAACLINHVGPIIICQAIARGILGRASFDEGLASAAFGLALQWLMSILIAACCFFAAPRLPRPLKGHWVGAGLLFGAVIFLVMNYVVVPLSAVGHAPHFDARGVIENLLAMLVFGLILSFYARAPQSTRQA